MFNKFNEDYKLFHQLNFTDILNQNNTNYSHDLKKHQKGLGTIQNNSRESIEEEPNDLMNTEGNQTIDRKPDVGAEDNAGLNTSIFMHSKLGLLDNQVTVNYDLTLPTQDGQKKVSRRKLFA